MRSPDVLSPRPNQISPGELVQAKQRLSTSKQSATISPLARSALHSEIVNSPRKLLEKTNSSSNLMQRIKNTFRSKAELRTNSENSIVEAAIQMND
jgi:hypothetical protein